jgi:replicative superfamily II helicase
MRIVVTSKRPLTLLTPVLLCSQSEFLFDNGLNWKLYALVKQHSKNKPTLVFCSSRKGCVTAANQVWLIAGLLFR